MLKEIGIPTPDIATIMVFIQAEPDQDTILRIYNNLLNMQDGYFQDPTLKQFIADIFTPDPIQQLGTDQLYREFTEKRLHEIYRTFPKLPHDLGWLKKALDSFLFGEDSRKIPPSSFASVHNFYTQITASTDVTLQKLYEICASINATDPATGEDTLPLLSPEMLEAYGLRGYYKSKTQQLANSIRETLPEGTLTPTQWSAFVDKLPSLPMWDLMDLHKILHAMNADNKKHNTGNSLLRGAVKLAVSCLAVSNFVLSYDAKPFLGASCVQTHSAEVEPVQLRINPEYSDYGTPDLLPDDQEKYDAIKQDPNSKIVFQSQNLEEQTAEFNVYTLKLSGVYRTTEILGHPITTQSERSLASCTAQLPKAIFIGENQIGQIYRELDGIVTVPDPSSNDMPGKVYRLQGNEAPTDEGRLQPYDGEHTDLHGRHHQHFGTFLEQRDLTFFPVCIAVLLLTLAYKNNTTRNALKMLERQTAAFQNVLMGIAGISSERQTTLQQFFSGSTLASRIKMLDNDRS